MAQMSSLATHNKAWDREVDLLVIGSGVAGLSAGLFGALRGVDVLICEEAAQVCGPSGTSDAIVWSPNPHIDSNAEAVRSYLEATLGAPAPGYLLSTYLEVLPVALLSLEQHSAVRFRSIARSGQSLAPLGGRILKVCSFDRRWLGRDSSALSLSRLPDKIDQPAFETNSVVGNAGSWVSRLARRVTDWNGTTLRAGDALIAALLFSFLRAGGILETESPLVRLVTQGGRVTGAEISSKGRNRRVLAREGVVLAIGGAAWKCPPVSKRDEVGVLSAQACGESIDLARALDVEDMGKDGAIAGRASGVQTSGICPNKGGDIGPAIAFAYQAVLHVLKGLPTEIKPVDLRPDFMKPLRSSDGYEVTLPFL